MKQNLIYKETSAIVSFTDNTKTNSLKKEDTEKTCFSSGLIHIWRSSEHLVQQLTKYHKQENHILEVHQIFYIACKNFNLQLGHQSKAAK